MQSSDNKILLGNSIPLPEEDLDDGQIDDYSIESLYDYWFNSILENINKSTFKQNYFSVINHIIDNCTIKQQGAFCYKILETIQFEYEFYLIEKLPILTQKTISNIYKFLEFIEFDNEDFIQTVWLFLDKESLKNDFIIENYCYDNSDMIIKEIEEQTETKLLNPLIINFLRTYTKNGIIRWFTNQSMKLRTSILLKILNKEIIKNV